MNNRDICAICGAEYGIHHGDTNSCPSGGVEETRPGFSQKWAKTQFVPTSEPIVSHDIIPLLTKREYVAIMVLGHIANGQPIADSEFAVKYADALIEALNK